MNYGIPYMGSKSSICADICKIFPSADNFYDLFGGGFSITHYMLMHRSKHFKEFHFNEIRPGVCDLVKDAINGKYSYNVFKPKWISREEFNNRKDHDPYIKLIWSFGNNGKNYLFGEDIEDYKKSLHNAIIFNEFDDTARQVLGMDKFRDGYSINDKRLILRHRITILNKGKKAGEIQQLQRLEQLERLEQLQQLERLQQLEFYSGSYQDVTIKDNSIIYCDIPYKDTADYGGSFSHEKFFEWAHNQSNPVFISEYNISDKRFKMILEVNKRSNLSSDKSSTLIKKERVYINDAAYKKLFNRA